MEQIANLAGAAMVQLQTNWQQSLPEDLNANKLSLYKPGKVNSKVFFEGVVKLKKAFPRLSNGWYDILETMLDEDGFSNGRFQDAVNGLIKTCPYPEPTIANVLGFDKMVKIHTYEEIVKMLNDDKNVFDKYTAIDTGLNVARWVRTEYAEKFNFKKWEKKN